MLVPRSPRKMDRRRGRSRPCDRVPFATRPDCTAGSVTCPRFSLRRSRDVVPSSWPVSAAPVVGLWPDLLFLGARREDRPVLDAMRTAHRSTLHLFPDLASGAEEHAFSFVLP